MSNLPHSDIDLLFTKKRMKHTGNYVVVIKVVRLFTPENLTTIQNELFKTSA